MPEPRPPRPSRRHLLQAAGVAGLAGLTGLTAARAGGPAPAAAPTAGAWHPDRLDRPVYGLLEAEPDQYAELARAGVAAVTLPVGWDRAQPQPGRLDEDYLAQVQRRHEAARARGLHLSLDPGLQYPPDWVGALPGARFVDQDGRPWRGGTGDDVVDGVFDEQVREAQGAYLRLLTDRLGDLELAGIRVGGLARGELHYPFTDRSRERATYWAYGRSAQARCPVPGFRPGQGSADDARTFVGWYLGALADHARWQLELLRDRADDGTRLIVLLPSWGLRPGEVERALAAGLDGSTSGEQRGTLTEGLDWEGQLAVCAAVAGVDVCTTWLDPQDQGEDQDLLSPGRFLAGLAARHDLGVWGENTGGNTAEDLGRCARRVRDLDLRGLFWMGAPGLGRDGNASLADYADVIDAAQA